MIRPGLGIVHWAAVLPLIGAVFFSGFQIVTRIITAREDHLATLFYTSAGGALLLSTAMPFFWQWPAWETWAWMAVSGAIGAGAHFLMINAFAVTEAALLAPFNYSRMLWAVLVGWLWFGDLPDTATLAGGGLIVASASTYCGGSRSDAVQPRLDQPPGDAVAARKLHVEILDPVHLLARHPAGVLEFFRVDIDLHRLRLGMESEHERRRKGQGWEAM